MKKLCVLLILGLFISCRCGPEETTMKAIAEFESEWSLLGQQSFNWSKELKNTIENCNIPPCDNDSIDNEESALICSCHEIEDVFNSLQVEWSDYNKNWEEATLSFDSWRNKITTGSIDDASANKSLDEFRVIYTDAANKLQSWTAAYNEAKGKYIESCATIDTLN